MASATDTVIVYEMEGNAGTSIVGSDHNGSSGSVTIKAGEQTAVIELPVLDDDLVEATETMFMSLRSISSSAAGVTLGTTTTASVNI